MRILFLFYCLSTVFFAFTQEFEFKGKHFFASYLDCDLEALQNVDRLIDAMDDAVKSSNATILNKTAHVFPPSGLTIVYLLSESHASIHTYPENGACFVDLFTCGDHCKAKPFHEVLTAYLKPKNVNSKLFLRDTDASEVESWEQIYETKSLN
jgi:S-adenosylmethionine decarboxylase